MRQSYKLSVAARCVVARVESVRSRQAESDREASPSGERHPVRDGAGVNGLFESLLAEAFDG